MAKFLFSVFSLSLLFALTATMNTVLAEVYRQPYDKWTQEPGFNGYIQLLTGGLSGIGLSRVDNDNRLIEDLESDAKTMQSEFITAYWELGYQFNQSNTTLFIGKPSSSVAEFAIPIELGVRHSFSDESIISASYLPRVSDIEVWEDPYLTQQSRRHTDLTLEGIRVSAEYIFGSPFSLMYDYSEQTLKNDRAGESLTSRLTSDEIKTLQRDATFSHACFQLTLPITNHFYIITGANYARARSEGEANRYTTSGFEMTVFYEHDLFEVFGHVYQNNTKYSKPNPVFDIERQDSSKGITVGISYLEPLSWNNTALDFIVSTTRRDANLYFYDEREEMVAFGLTYKF
jgi:hypothetical protein